MPLTYEELCIRKYPCWTVYLNANQSYLGSCYAWLNREGGMQRFSDVSVEELFELHGSVLPAYEKAIDSLWKPSHMNYAWLGNHIYEHAGHGHLHLIPRYASPILFAGREFKDERWGQNYAPRPKPEPEDDILLLIRDALKYTIT